MGDAGGNVPARRARRAGTDGVGRAGPGQLPEEWRSSHWVKTRNVRNVLGMRIRERFLRPTGPQNQVRVLVPNGGHMAQSPCAMGTRPQLQSLPPGLVPMCIGTRGRRRLDAF